MMTLEQLNTAELAEARAKAFEEAANVAEDMRTDDDSLWDCAAASIAQTLRAMTTPLT